MSKTAKPFRERLARLAKEKLGIRTVRPDEDDVIACYRALLGREPESEQVVKAHAANANDLSSLLRQFITSEEARRKYLWEGVAYAQNLSDARRIVLDQSAEAREWMFSHVRSVWSRYGVDDVYFSVLTDPQFSAAAIDDAAIDRFYRSGKGDVESLQNLCIRNELRMPPQPIVAELGCGVGRIAEHFAPVAKKYIGIDISIPHLALARARMSEKTIANAQFFLLEEFLRSDEEFDVFFSVITLQHNPPPLMLWLLGQFLSRVSSGGVAYFQLPCHLHDYQFNAAAYRAGKGRSDEMEMHALPQRYVFEALSQNGFQLIEASLDGRIGNLGLSYSFLATRTRA